MIIRRALVVQNQTQIKFGKHRIEQAFAQLNDISLIFTSSRCRARVELIFHLVRHGSGITYQLRLSRFSIRPGRTETRKQYGETLVNLPKSVFDSGPTYVIHSQKKNIPLLLKVY